MLKKNKINELVDPSLADEYDSMQMNLMILAASLCVQQSSIKRPRISQVPPFSILSFMFETYSLRQSPGGIGFSDLTQSNLALLNGCVKNLLLCFVQLFP